MAAIPLAVFSTSKIHEHLKAQNGFEEHPSRDKPGKTFHQNAFALNKVLQNYNNKLMNSIWGQYNLYASHAFQKNSEGATALIEFFHVPQVKNLWDTPYAHPSYHG